MIIELLLPSIVAGLLIAVASGLLGCFVVWRRMAFFSDTLAHSAVLGTALALIAGVDLIYGLIGYGALVAVVMARFDNALMVSADTLLAIIAQASLAAGLLLIPLAGTNLNIEALLFGDILTIRWLDVGIAAIVTVIIGTTLSICYKPLIDLCIDEELAAIEGVAVARHKLVLFLLLVALIAVAVRLVGVLLISALLLVPAAATRRLAGNPLQMLLLAPAFGIVSVLSGLYAAYALNAAAGPAIVVAATLLWLVTLARKNRA